MYNNIEETITKLREGNQSAFSEFYEIYWGKVFNYCKLYLKDEIAIEEAVQDVFVRIWESRHLLDEKKNIEGYLFIIARNIIFNCFKKKLDHVAIDITLIATLSDYLDATDLLIEREIRESIELIYNKLPPRQQEAFRLSRHECLSYKEIAKVMNISEKTVEQHISSALAKIKKDLKFVFILL